MGTDLKLGSPNKSAVGPLGTCGRKEYEKSKQSCVDYCLSDSDYKNVLQCVQYCQCSMPMSLEDLLAKHNLNCAIYGP